MPTITVDPATGRLMLDGQVLDRNDPRLYGSTGRMVTNISAGDVGSQQAGDYDPRYYEAYTENNGDAGETTSYRLRPEIERRLGGRTQLRQSGTGGYQETLDPSQLEWDDEFGILTKPENIGAPDDGSFIDQYGIFLPAAIAAGGIAMQAGGLLGGGGAAAGGGAGAGGLSLPGLMAPVDLGGLSVGSMASSTIPGLGGAAGAIGGAAGAGSGTPLMLAPGMENAAMIDSWLINNGMSGLAGGNITAGLGGLLGDSGALGSIGSNVLNAAISNPQAVLGLLSGIGGAGGGSSGGGWSGDSTPLNIGSSNYAPNAQTQRQLDDLYGGKMDQANNGLKGGQMPTNTGINPAYGGQEGRTWNGGYGTPTFPAGFNNGIGGSSGAPAGFAGGAAIPNGGAGGNMYNAGTAIPPSFNPPTAQTGGGSQWIGGRVPNTPTGQAEWASAFGTLGAPTPAPFAGGAAIPNGGAGGNMYNAGTAIPPSFNPPTAQTGGGSAFGPGSPMGGPSGAVGRTGSATGGMPQGNLGQQSGYGLRPGTSWVSPNGMYARDANGQQYMTANQQYQQQSATPQWNGGSYSGPLDSSWQNIAKGDQYTGVRDGHLWAAGNRISPSFGNLEQDRMELARQFGVGGPSVNTNPLLQGRMPAKWAGGLLGG